MKTMRNTLILAALLLLTTTPIFAQPGGTAGAFTRMGFGARGQGMGNALTAIPEGTISPYYNPALSPFQTGHVLHGSYSFLSLDRVLNQISYTQRLSIKRPNANKFKEDPDVQSYAGISAGWINAGDGNIQGYDSDGFKTEELSVFENQFYFNIANRFSEKLSIGLTFKFYHSGLYEDVTTSGFGADIGLLWSFSEQVHLGIVVQELVTEYEWDTSELYGPEFGNTTSDPFARIVRLGGSYILPDSRGLIAADFEMYDGDTFLARVGAEYKIVEQFALRAGVERLDLSDNNIDARPSFGLSVTQPWAQFVPTIHYAFIIEPVAPSSTHVLSFALSF
ncbi:MAG: hypothetical protein CL946_12555 [Ectothiorhodospiraceae bacterium]|nr:hypothetical protein [Ectothiorhodospiraceae bacterium]